MESLMSHNNLVWNCELSKLDKEVNVEDFKLRHRARRNYEWFEIFKHIRNHEKEKH